MRPLHGNIRYASHVVSQSDVTYFSPCMFTLRAEHNTRVGQQLLQVGRLRFVVFPAFQ